MSLTPDRPFAPDSPFADKLYPSPNHGERKAAPDSIILHYTGMADAASALLWLCNPLSEVSCHYVVFEDGRIWQLVPESRRAWHAGRSCWQGERDMNSCSIGIEIVHPGHDLTKASASDVDAGLREADASKAAKPNPFPPPGPPFPEVQIETVIRLVADIKARWRIADRRILAHSDIAPGRKIDPGEGFPWQRLAEAGLGLWPSQPLSKASPLSSPASPLSWPGLTRPSIASGKLDPRLKAGDDKGGGHDKVTIMPAYSLGDEGMPVAALQALFARFGYDLEITGVYDQRLFDVVAAFQRHWRQDKVDGVADGETMAVLKALIGL